MLNKVVLMGRLTRDPELRRTPNDIAVTTFTLAVDRRFSRGENKETDFIDIVCWRNNAEFVAKYFRKGSLTAVCGSLQGRTWKDKDGNNRKTFEVVADEVHFAESKRDSSGQPSATSLSEDNAAFSLGAPSEFQEIEDDDLPF